jgi:periplasmic protein TonB
VDISQWTPEVRETVAEVFDSRKSYLEMVRLRIERYKRYPDEAVSRQVEGRVTVHFRITFSGAVRDVSIAKTSRHRALEKAALTSVRNAAPFPTPPFRFFRGEVALNITIVFELT